MKKKKQMLIGLTALIAILSSNVANAETNLSAKNEKLYNSMIKNLEKGTINDSHYKTIEKILKQKNKELKDLYEQGDYIVKPEYLEWQVFATGFYTEYGKGRDNTSESAKYRSQVSGYYDVNGDYVVTSGSRNGISGKSFLQLQKGKEMDLGIGIQVREPTRQPISLGISKPSIPLITIGLPNAPTVISPIISVTPKQPYSIPVIGIPTAPTPITIPTITLTPINLSSFTPPLPPTPPTSLGSSGVVINPTFMGSTNSIFPVGTTTINAGTYTLNGSPNNGLYAFSASNQTLTFNNGNILINQSAAGSIASNNTFVGQTINNDSQMTVNLSSTSVMGGFHSNTATGYFTFNNNKSININYDNTATTQNLFFYGNILLNNSGNIVMENKSKLSFKALYSTWNSNSGNSTPLYINNTGTITIKGDPSILFNLTVMAHHYGHMTSTANGQHTIVNTGTITIDHALGMLQDFSTGIYDASGGGIMNVTNQGVGLELTLTGNTENIFNQSTLKLGIMNVDGITNPVGTYSKAVNIIPSAFPTLTVDIPSGTINLTSNSMGIITSLPGSQTIKNAASININGDNSYGIITHGGATGVATVLNSGNIKLNVSNTTELAAGIFHQTTNLFTNTGNIEVISTGTNQKGTIGIILPTGANFLNNGGGVSKILADGSRVIGLVSLQNTTGTIKDTKLEAKNGGIAAYSYNGSNIVYDNITAEIDNGGLLFYTARKGVPVSTMEFISNSEATIKSGGIAFYIDTVLADVTSSYVGLGNLNLKLQPNSSIFLLESPAPLSIGSIPTAGGLGLTIDASSTGYRDVTISKGSIIVDAVSGNPIFNLDNTSDALNKNAFYFSKITLASGSSITGTGSSQIALGQVSYNGSTSSSDVSLTNNGTINLSGAGSIGITGDFADSKNSNTIQVHGNNSIGMFIANGSIAINEGLIELGGSGSAGIYGLNYYDLVTSSSILGYGNDKIDITNDKDIKTIVGGVTGNVLGVSANNALALSDSKAVLTANSDIDLEGTGTIIGAYLKATELTSDGSIKVTSGTTGTAVGIYSESGSTASTPLTGVINVSGGSGTGLFLKESSMTSNATISLNNVTNGIGLYIEGTTLGSASGVNGGTVNLSSNVTGMYGSGTANTGTITNTGTIQTPTSGGDKAIGMFVGANGIGTNTGTIKLVAIGTDSGQVGVYNNTGTFTMTGGNIEVLSPNAAGVYATATSTTNISGGTIKTGAGAIGLYADNTTINLSGTYKSIVENEGIFALNDAGSVGKINVTGNIVVDIEAGGMAFSSVGALSTYLGTLVNGTGTLEINLKDQTSKLAIMESPGIVSLSSVGTAYAPGATITSNVKISATSNPNYIPFSMLKGTLLVDIPINLDNSTDFYNKADIINSSVDVNSTITGTTNGQLAVGQLNYVSGVISDITLNNNNIIDLLGDNSTALLGDFADITNTTGSQIKVTASNSVGIYGANGSVITNDGTINIGNQSVGIYGGNYLSTVPGYGNGSIDIKNNGSIVSTGTTHGGYGIYANNSLGLTSSVVLGSASNIDVSSSENGIGIYATNSILDINGNITVGKNGLGVYAVNSTGDINGGTINLIGNNAVGYYLTNSSTLDNYAGSIHVDGQNITLMITDATSSINLISPFTVTSTPGSTYVVGNMVGGDFYNNTSATLGSNGSLINGLGTVSLFGTASNINSTGTNVSGMVLSGQHASIPYTFTSPGITVNEEGTNLGNISLGDSSAGMYLTNGARGRNEGIISVNNQSVGIYADGAGSHIENNNGIITIGQESTGMFLKNGNHITNSGIGEINSTSQKAVGIYLENTTAGIANITNNSKIDLNGDQSLGIYSTGANNILNTGLIQIGTSASQTQPGVGIYADNALSTITNNLTGNINVGDNSIGIYNIAGTVTNNGNITTGHGGTAIYSDGGIINLNAGSNISVGQNDGVGVYAVNQTGTVINNSTMTIGDGSFGFVFSGATTPSFQNNEAITIGNNSIFVYSDSVLTADNNNILTMTGSDNVGYYLKNGGSFVNNANIIGNTGVANIGIYAKGAIIVNNADIIMGDSNLVEHTDASGVKYKTGYSVGIYGENSNITNNSGHTIQIGKDGIGMYVKGAGFTAENYGIINGAGNDSKGIFAADYSIVNNYGTINMNGDNVMGIAGQNGAQIYNAASGKINVTGNDVVGIYLAGDDTKLINHGQINITGTGLGISYTPTVSTTNVVDITGTTQGYTSKQYDLPNMPTLINTGVININVGGNFNYDGIKVIIDIDPTTNTPVTDSTTQVGFGGVLPNKVEIAPNFSIGTATDRYVFENLFRGTTGKGEYISQSLTWDATAIGSDLVMTRKAYTDFTDGLWFEDFGRALNDKYAVTTGEGRKIYDKINQITDESDFRFIMGSLAGDVYSNMNQRERDIADAFEDSLHILQNSSNNTKENVKISVIGGKGKNQGETDGVPDYDYTTTGVLALREVERTYKHTFGYSLGYLHTRFNFKDGNSSDEDVDTIQLGLHNKYKTNGWQLRNDLTGRVSIHNVDRNIDWASPIGRSEMNANYEAYSITSDNILGKEFKLGKNFGIMPYGGFKAMYVTRPGFEEDGLEALNVERNDAWSAKPRAGIEIQSSLPIGSSAWELKGTLDLAYEYELANLNERERAKLVSIEDNYHNLSKPEKEKGIFKTKASVGVEVADRYGIYLTGEYLVDKHKEGDYRAGVNLKAVF